MKLEIHYLYIAKYAKWIIISLISFFTLLILFEWTSLFISPIDSTVSTAPTQVPTGPKNGLAENVLSASLFGVYVPNNLNNVKKSMLDVTLFGILLSNNTNDSQVIIGSASGDERSYKIGDQIPGGAVIKRITGDGVLVERNGALESLSLPKNDLTFEPAAKPLKED